MRAQLSRRRLRLFAFVLLPALFLRALVPAGYMPGEGGGFGVTMQLCVAHGLQTVVVYPDGSIGADGAGPQFSHACPYALGALAGPLPVVAGVALARISSPRSAAAPVQAVPASPCPRAQSPRAPPALA